MDLPDDKRQVVMKSSQEKKWQLVRDNTRRTRQNPPKEYLSKLHQVMESAMLETSKRARKRATDSSTIQALQGLEISLRTNNIRCSIYFTWDILHMHVLVVVAYNCLQEWSVHWSIIHYLQLQLGEGISEWCQQRSATIGGIHEF